MFFTLNVLLQGRPAAIHFVFYFNLFQHLSSLIIFKRFSLLTSEVLNHKKLKEALNH